MSRERPSMMLFLARLAVFLGAGVVLGGIVPRESVVAAGMQEPRVATAERVASIVEGYRQTIRETSATSQNVFAKPYFSEGDVDLIYDFGGIGLGYLGFVPRELSPTELTIAMLASVDMVRTSVSLNPAGKAFWEPVLLKVEGLIHENIKTIDGAEDEQAGPIVAETAGRREQARVILEAAIQEVARTKSKRAVPLTSEKTWPLVTSAAVKLSQQVTRTVLVNRMQTQYRPVTKTVQVPVTRIVKERVPVQTMTKQLRTIRLPDGSMGRKSVDVPITTYQTVEKKVTEMTNRQVTESVPYQYTVAVPEMRTEMVSRRVREYLEPIRVELKIAPDSARVFYMARTRLDFLKHSKKGALSDDFESWAANWQAVDTKPPTVKVCAGVEYGFRAYWEKGKTFKRDKVRRDTDEPIEIKPDLAAPGSGARPLRDGEARPSVAVR